jgi:hypothetical protein
MDKEYLKSVKFDELYAEYGVWTDLNGYKRVSSARFEQEVAEEFELKKDDNMFIDK